MVSSGQVTEAGLQVEQTPFSKRIASSSSEKWCHPYLGWKFYVIVLLLSAVIFHQHVAYVLSTQLFSEEVSWPLPKSSCLSHESLHNRTVYAVANVRMSVNGVKSSIWQR